MSVEGGGDARCGIGTRLRSARERKGLTILQAAEKLHVDARILESLESENFGALGAPVYVRGHLRHYAELIGESPAELLGLYSNSIKTVQPDLTRIPKAPPPDAASKLVAPALVVLVGFAVAGTVWWVFTLSSGRPPGAQGSVQSENTATPSGVQASAVQAVGLSGNGEAVPLAPQTQPRAAATAPAQPQPVPPKQTAPGAAVRVAPASKQAELTLKFSADSWAEVYDASGERLFYDIGAADSVRMLKGTPPLHIMLGNAPGVALEVNGRPEAITGLIGSDGSAHFLINRSGRAVRAKQADGG